jgi:hypothetical protein
MPWHLLLNRCMVTSLPQARHFVGGYSLALRLLSSLVAWLVAFSSAWNHSCWSPFAGPTLIPILSGTISYPQFHCYIYGVRLEMKNKGRSCTIMHRTEVLILIASTLLIYPYFICKFVFGLHSSEFNFSVKVCWWGEGTIQLLNVSFFNFLFLWLILLLGIVTFFLFHSCTKCLFGCLYLWWLCFKMW